MGTTPWVILRGVLLIALLALLVVSLVTSLLAEHPEALLGPGAPGFGEDPGIRVLLLEDRDDPDHDRLTVRPLQDALLYCPDDKENWHLQLDPLHPVELLPQGRDGILVNIPSRSFTQTWEVDRLALTSRNLSEPDAPIPDLATVEAGDGAPLFALARSGGRQYRGNLEVILASATALNAVNALPIEAYLEGVLQSELAAHWPDAALRAQAIAARSYAYAATWEGRSERSGLLRYDLTDRGLDPAYRGTGASGQKIDWALRATRGQILTHLGRAFRAYFHAASGGHTASVAAIEADARTVDGALALADVMPAQEDPWYQPGLEALDQGDRYGRRTVTITAAQLRSRLEGTDHEATWVNRITAERNAAGRVDTVTLKIIPSPDITFTGEEFRHLLGVDADGRYLIRSTLWSEDSPATTDAIGTWAITTTGWGHGVGMSQISAYAMAREGFTDRDILQQFYVGTEIEKKW